MLFQSSATRFERKKYINRLESHWVMADQPHEAPDEPVGP